MKRSILAGSLGLSLALLTNTASAEEPWWKVPNPLASKPSAAAHQVPAVTLGRPVGLVPDDAPEEAVSATVSRGSIQPVAWNTPKAELARPQPIIRAQAGDAPVPSSPPPVPPPGFGPVAPLAPQERYNSGVVVDPPPGQSKGWMDWMKFGQGGTDGGYHNGERKMFESDHCYDQFSSPVSNPFIFEDPRALTEARPIFIWQKVPSSNYAYDGGNIFWAGTQLRVAFTDWFSVVVNKLGWIWNDPGQTYYGVNTALQQANGFSELMVGPKFTFLRNENTGTLMAGGLTFDIPTGPQKVFQNTGNLSLIPYLSFGQNFFKTDYGSMNFLMTPAYSYSTDSQRTDYFSLSGHLDYNVGNLNRIYPFVEVNWTNFTKAGTVRPLGFEGRDLINFGSTGVSGNNNVSLALGSRFMYNQHFQFGIAAEFPIAGRHDLLDFRVTTDFIIRY